MAAAQPSFMRWALTIYNDAALVEFGFKMVDAELVHVHVLLALGTFRFTWKSLGRQCLTIMCPAKGPTVDAVRTLQALNTVPSIMVLA